MVPLTLFVTRVATSLRYFITHFVRMASKNLILSKLVELLTKRSYIINAVYVCNELGGTGGTGVRLVEVRTPKMQKLFIIYIPTKYTMICNTTTYKVKRISETTSRPLAKQSDYVSTVKGNFLECDLLTHSADFICLYKNNGTTENYRFGEVVNKDKKEVDVDENPIDQFISDSEVALKKIDPGISLSSQRTLSDDITTELDESTVVEAPGSVELEFVGDVGVGGDSDLDDIKEFIDSGALGITNAMVDDDDSDVEGDEVVDSAIGIIYYAIDISLFYKKIGNLEDEILTIYNTIDDNESTIRDDRLADIEDLAQSLIIHTKDKLEKYKKEEIDLKAQIVKLSIVLDKTLSLKEKIKVDPEKYIEAQGEIDRVYNQTRNTVYDINIELLKIRDDVDDVLSMTQSTLEGLIDS